MKRGKKFLEILNSKPVIGVLIFVMLSLVGVFAGDMVFDSGDLNVSNIFYVNESSGNVGIGTSTPSEKLEVEGNLNVTGNYIGNGSQLTGISTSLSSYDTGWINRSDWTNVHMGSDDTLNTDSNVTHNLNADITQLKIMVYITDKVNNWVYGADTIIAVSLGNDESYGITAVEVDDNNIQLQTGGSGLMLLRNDGGLRRSATNQALSYKIKVWKLG